MAQPPIYGLLAEFDEVDALVSAAKAARQAGYRRLDAYTPLPVEALNEAIGIKPTRLPLIVLIGGLIGGFGGYLMQYYAHVISYPLNIGGRPLNSWPLFIPITFELTILGASVAGVLGMLALNGLPMPYHPLFHVPRFAQASRNRFFLCIEARDARFDREKTAAFLASLMPREVTEVPH